MDLIADFDMESDLDIGLDLDLNPDLDLDQAADTRRFDVHIDLLRCFPRRKSSSAFAVC